MLAAMGVPVKAIMERVGHSDPKVTLSVYTHITQEMKEQLDECLERMTIWKMSAKKAATLNRKRPPGSEKSAQITGADFWESAQKVRKSAQKKKRFETFQSVLKTANPAW